MISGLVQDLRFSGKNLLRSPGFTAIVVLTLGLGIGANTTIFSIINAFVLRPLPVASPDEFVQLLVKIKGSNGYSDFNYPDYIDYKKSTESFSGMIAQTLVRAGLNEEGERSELVWGQLVSGNYFDVVGVKPALGRGFLPEEDEAPGRSAVAVVSHNLWTERLAADPQVLGRTVQLNGRPFTVVGVTPQSFPGTKFGLAVDFWVPVMMRDELMADGARDWQETRGGGWLNVFGRLAPGVSLEQAQTEVKEVSARLREQYPKENEDKSVQVFPEWQTRGGHPEVGGARMLLTTGFVLALVSLVLLIACANVVNLLLARAVRRQSEMGVRIALGAGRARLARQLFTENMVLALIGGLVGVLVAYWGAGLVKSLLPQASYNVVFDFRPDAAALLYTLVVALVTGAVLGLAPALHASRTEVIPILKGDGAGGPGRGRSRLRSLLVVVQLAVSLMLLVVAGLFANSLASAQSADPGFETERGLVSSVDLSLLDYTEEEGRAFYRQLRERVAALPGVRSVSLAQIVPLGDTSQARRLYREGADLTSKEEAVPADWNTVDTGYFETVGIPLVQGRAFTAADTAESTPVVIINQTLARRLWPDESPLGKRLVFRGEGEELREVVGVARDGKYRRLTEDPVSYVYVPFAQSYEPAMTLHVQAEGDPGQLVPSLRQAVTGLDPNLPVYDVKTLKTHMVLALWPARIGAAMAGASGALALFIAVVGIYGGVSYSVSQRTREVGVRMAFGGRREDLLGLIVRQGMTLAVVGIGIGLALSFGLSKAISKVIYGVKSGDPVLFAGTTVLLLAVCLVACYIPARRASRLDPMVALREP